MAANDTESSPLQDCVDDAKDCINDIDELVKEIKKSKSLDVLQYKNYLKRKETLEGDADDIIQDMKELSIDDEPTKPKHFDKTRTSTIKRLETYKKTLDTTLTKAKPPELKDTVSTDSKKSSKSKLKDQKADKNKELEDDDTKSSKNKKSKEKDAEEKKTGKKSKSGDEEDEEEDEKDDKKDKKKKDKTSKKSKSGDEEDEEEDEKDDKKDKKKKDKKSKKSKSGDEEDEEEDEKDDKKDKKKKDKKSKKSKSGDEEDEEEDEKEDKKDKKKKDKKSKKSKSGDEEDEKDDKKKKKKKDKTSDLDDEDEEETLNNDESYNNREVKTESKHKDFVKLKPEYSKESLASHVPDHDDDWNSESDNEESIMPSTSANVSSTPSVKKAGDDKEKEEDRNELSDESQSEEKRSKTKKEKSSMSEDVSEDDETKDKRKKSKTSKKDDEKSKKDKKKKKSKKDSSDKENEKEEGKKKKSKEDKKDKKSKSKDKDKKSAKESDEEDLSESGNYEDEIEESVHVQKAQAAESTPVQNNKSEDEYTDDDFESGEEEEVIVEKPKVSPQESSLSKSDRPDMNVPTPKLRASKAASEKNADVDEEYDSYSDDEEEEEEEEDLTLKNKVCTAEKSFKALEQGDLSVSEGERLTVVRAGVSGWWKVRNSKGEEGVVPGNRLKIVHSQKGSSKLEVEEEFTPTKKQELHQSRRPKSAKQLWSKVSEALDSARMNDIIKHHFHVTPSGFRMITLGMWRNADYHKLGLYGYLSPRLSSSQFQLLDLQYNAESEQLRPREAKFQRIVQIQKLIQFPALSSEIEVLQRNTRMCLFNGEKAISNIHMIQCGPPDPKNMKQWIYSSKVADQMKSVQYSEVFIRFNHPSTEVSLLIEFSVVLHKPNSPDNVEMSVGWVSVPLYTPSTNHAIPNKNFDYELNGGTPFDSGIPVEAGLTTQPKVTLKIYQPNAATKEILNTLPDIIIGNLSLIQFYSYYRQILAESLVRDRPHINSNKPIFSPFLSTFPKVADQSDIMDVLRFQWINAQKRDKRLNKKDPKSVRNLFQKVFMETAYPIACLSSLPFYNPNVNGVVQKRLELITKLVDYINKNSVVKAFQFGEFEFYPVTPEEMVFSISNPYCVFESVTPNRE